jgi:hypothetical protein
MDISGRKIWYSSIVDTMKGGYSRIAAASRGVNNTCGTIEVAEK